MRTKQRQTIPLHRCLLNCGINAVHVDCTVSFADAGSMPIKCLLGLVFDVNVAILRLDGSDFLAVAQPICVIAYVAVADARSMPIKCLLSFVVDVNVDTPLLDTSDFFG